MHNCRTGIPSYTLIHVGWKLKTKLKISFKFLYTLNGNYNHSRLSGRLNGSFVPIYCVGLVLGHIYAQILKIPKGSQTFKH